MPMPTLEANVVSETVAVRPWVAACQTMLGFGVSCFFWATRHRVVIPVVIPQFHSASMTTPWRVAAYFACPIVWHTAGWARGYLKPSLKPFRVSEKGF